jgi:transcription elongation factor Elf1
VLRFAVITIQLIHVGVWQATHIMIWGICRKKCNCELNNSSMELHLYTNTLHAVIKTTQRLETMQKENQNKQEKYDRYYVTPNILNVSKQEKLNIIVSKKNYSKNAVKETCQAMK